MTDTIKQPADLEARLRALVEEQTLRSYAIPVALVDPSPENPNSMSAAEYAAEKKSLIRYGWKKAAMVRPYDATDREELLQVAMLATLVPMAICYILGEPPSDVATFREGAAALERWYNEEGGKRWELLDGNHRRAIMLEFIRDGLPAGVRIHEDLRRHVENRTMPCSVHPMARSLARHWRLVCTYNRGSGHEIPAGTIAKKLVEQVGMQDLLDGLPWTERTAQQMIDAASFDWQAHLDLERRKAEDRERRRLQTPPTFKIVVTGPEADRGDLERLLLNYSKDHPGVQYRG